ncbi:unnamed protein product [Rhizoctonia solani]|uniref:Uncharacterized protein n=1 Tax=Rhizoctonia solani TaxID=456999 RepID=A0A8H3E3F0_9AGAM|nr:unnamed protein product [Rhizoctonia solani]
MAGRPLSCENDRPSQLFAQPKFSLAGLVLELGARPSRISAVWVRGSVEAQAHGLKAEPEPQIRELTPSARPLNHARRLDAALPRAHGLVESASTPHRPSESRSCQIPTPRRRPGSRDDSRKPRTWLNAAPRHNGYMSATMGSAKCIEHVARATYRCPRPRLPVSTTYRA